VTRAVLHRQRTASSMRIALFWAVTQRVGAIPYRR